MCDSDTDSKVVTTAPLTTDIVPSEFITTLSPFSSAPEATASNEPPPAAMTG